MSDNETQPIDPATCEPLAWMLGGKLVLPADEWSSHAYVSYRRGAARYAPRPVWIRDTIHDGLPSGAVPLVRQDEAQAVAEWLVAEARDKGAFSWWGFQAASLTAERDRWKAECEKALVERDELLAALGEANDARIQLLAELKRREVELGEVRQAATELAPAPAVDPDPTSASRLQLAAETVEAVAPSSYTTVGSLQVPTDQHLQELANKKKAEAEAAVAREQERDAEIAAVVRVLPAFVPGTSQTFPTKGHLAAALIDVLDAHRNERSEK